MNHMLSHFADVAGIDIVRDGAFQTTGKLSTPLRDICAPVRSAEWLPALLRHGSVAAVVTTAELAEAVPDFMALALAKAPQDAHCTIHALCAEEAKARLRSAPTVIAPSAIIDPRAVVSPYGVSIGERVEVEAYAQIYPGTVVDDDCTIRSGASIGLDGFAGGVIGGRYRILPQVGGTRLGRNVHVMPRVCVSRAVFGGDTVIGDETIIDTQAYIAHDCVLGRRVIVCAMANISGRVEIGDEVHVGPSSVIRNGLRLGDRSHVSMGAVVTRDVPAGQRVTGNFAIPHERFLENLRANR